MIILDKKRILAMVSMICISVLVFSFHIAKEEKVQETMALPVTNKVIVIDAGHGVPDEGAQSSNRNNRSTNEFEDCFKITNITRTKRFNSYFDKE